MKKEEIKEPKFKPIIEGANKLSLGISMVVAILLGIGIGKLMQHFFGGSIWWLWLGIFWGVAAAGLNIYKMYKVVKKDLDSVKDDPKYQHQLYTDKYEDDGLDKYGK
jgi:F0F1-type ATP synthase assembly protein I